MTGDASRLSVQVVDPRFGPAMDLGDQDAASVELDVEHADWSPRQPSAGATGPIVWVDGAQRVEAWLTVSDPQRSEPLGAVCFAVAAGAVETGAPGTPARIVATELRRGVVAAGDETLELPPVGAFRWDPATGSAREPTGMQRRIGQARQQIEHALAERLAEADRLVILDGRLSFVRDARGPVVGAIKSHQRMYLPEPQLACVGALAVGERTPLFAIGDDRLSWYLRLPGAGERGWAGVLRCELARAVGLARAVELADRTATELPRFAGRPHRDPRAPQNMSPIGGLEERLKHLMGDRRLAVRAIRRAALAARIDAAPTMAPVRVEPAESIAA